MPVERDFAPGGVALYRFPFGQQGDDASVTDSQCMVLQYRIGGFHQDDPAGADEQVDRFGHGRVVGVASRSAGKENPAGRVFVASIWLITSWDQPSRRS